MPPRRVQLKSSLTTVIAEAKKNFDEQKQCFQQEACDLVEKWHQNSLRNFDALQLRISEMLVNDGCSEKQDIVKEKSVKELQKIDLSMPSLEPACEEPSIVDLIKSLENFVEEEVPIQIKNQNEKFEDPMFGLSSLPIVMTPSTALTIEPFMSTTFDFPTSPVTFSEYELNEIGELTLLGVDVENRSSGEQINLPNGGSHKTLEQSNHLISLVKQAANVNKRIKALNDALPLKRRKKEENAVPNAIKLLQRPKTGLMHKIIVDKETLAQMREQKKVVKQLNAIKSKAKATEVGLSLLQADRGPPNRNNS